MSLEGMRPAKGMTDADSAGLGRGALAGVQFVFLDRDGVINRKLPEGCYVTRIEDFKLLPGAAQAIARLNASGLTVILVTNQRAIGLGLMTEPELDQLHKHLCQHLAAHGARLDAIYYCPHDPSRRPCTCRKPETGLFEQAMRDFPSICSQNSLVIGDSFSDIQVGSRLGMRTIFIEGELLHAKACADQAAAMAGAVARSLEDAVNGLL
jgi:D-glycero-D-manno-heptose 1,7-bisphosphate phosphatase